MKKSILILFIFLIVIIATSTGCKKKEYMIVGIWRLNTPIWNDEIPAERYVTFTGDINSGTISWTVSGIEVGTYSVDGENVEFNISYVISSVNFAITEVYTGTFVDEFYMRGSATVNGIDAGSWNAQKF